MSSFSIITFFCFSIALFSSTKAKNFTKIGDYLLKRDCVISRFRIGLTALIHSYLLNRQPAPNCIICHTPFIGPHFLLYCSKYVASRSLMNNLTFFNHILNNDLSPTPLDLPKINRSIVPENVARFLYSLMPLAFTDNTRHLKKIINKQMYT